MDRHGLAWGAGLAAVGCALALVPAGGADARARRLPDLRVQVVTQAQSSVFRGQTITIRDRVVNRGRARARRSAIGYYLDRGGRRVATLGRRGVKALRPHRHSSHVRSFRVPFTLPAGVYRVLACADVKRRVRESRERNNCRSSRRLLRVRVPVGNPTTSASGGAGDSAPPAVGLTTPANGATTALMVFSGPAGTAPGDDSIVTLKIYSGTDTTATPTDTQTATVSGSAWSLVLSPVLADGQVYTAVAEQRDADGNVGRSDPHTFTVPYTLLAAGDIASCASSGDEATAALLAQRAGTIATLGDNVYDDGDPQDPEASLANFNACFQPSWGPFNGPRIRPSPGNHEYTSSSTADGYFSYFGAVASQGTNGDYSYDIGSWHVIVLNTNSDCDPMILSCAAGSPQETWLKNDLAAHPSTCTLAYFHHPRFSSTLGPNSSITPFWTDLNNAGADVVLNGHAHNYERFAPQKPDGTADPTGITEFIAGTGGASHDALTGPRAANSATFDADTFGILQLTLRPGGYDYSFVPAPGTGPWSGESGAGSCH